MKRMIKLKIRRSRGKQWLKWTERWKFLRERWNFKNTCQHFLWLLTRKLWSLKKSLTRTSHQDLDIVLLSHNTLILTFSIIFLFIFFRPHILPEKCGRGSNFSHPHSHLGSKFEYFLGISNIAWSMFGIDQSSWVLVLFVSQVNNLFETISILTTLYLHSVAEKASHLRL